MFVTFTFLLYFPFLTENSQLKNIMCVPILLTIIFGIHNDGFFSSHDWPDADCVKILSGVKKAMAPHSRVLVRKSYSNFTSEKKNQLYSIQRNTSSNLQTEFLRRSHPLNKHQSHCYPITGAVAYDNTTSTST